MTLNGATMAAGAAEDRLPAPRIREFLASRLRLDTGLAYGGNAASLLCLVLTNLAGNRYCCSLLSSLQSVLLEAASFFAISTAGICVLDLKCTASEREDRVAAHFLTVIILL